MKEWKNGSVMKGDAEKVASELENLGEELTPEQIVSFAKHNEDSELHKCFEWDDTIAAEKYRLDQARLICRMLVDVKSTNECPEETVKIRVFEHIVKDKTSVYIPTLVAMENEAYRQQVLEDILRRIGELQIKASNYQEIIRNSKKFQETLEVSKKFV